MEVRVVNRQPVNVAFVRHVGLYEECGPAWRKLSEWAAPKGLLGPETVPIGICHDNPEVTPPDRLRYDACITLAAALEPEGEVGVQEIPGGDYASASFRGPYSGLKEVWRAVFEDWLPQSGRRFRDAPCFEIYLNDPRTTPPEELLTEVYVPLQEES
jgi:AraC family transcriptional regulator